MSTEQITIQITKPIKAGIVQPQGKAWPVGIGVTATRAEIEERGFPEDHYRVVAVDGKKVVEDKTPPAGSKKKPAAKSGKKNSATKPATPPQTEDAPAAGE